jgi:hypothetical protein
MWLWTLPSERRPIRWSADLRLFERSTIAFQTSPSKRAPVATALFTSLAP